MSSHAGSQTASKTPFKAWIILSIIVIPYVMSMFIRAAPSVISLDLAKDFAVEVPELAVISAATMVAYGIIQIPAGLLADSFGGKNTIVLFPVGLGCANIWFGMAETLGSAAAARFAVGLSAASFVPAMTIVAHWFTAGNFAKANSVMLLGGNLGTLLASAPLVFLCGIWGWRGVMCGFGILCFVLAGVTFFYVKNAPASFVHPGEKTRKPSLLAGLKTVAVSGKFWPLCISFCCLIGVFFSLTTLWMGPFLMHGCGMSREETGGILFAFSLVAFVAIPLLAAVSDKIRSRRKVLVGSLGAAVLAMLMIAFAAGKVPVWVLLGLYFVFVFAVGCSSLFFTAAKEMFPVEMYGTVVGCLNMFPYFCTALLQKLFAVVLAWRLEACGGNTAAAYGQTFWLNVLLVLMAFVAALKLKETYPQR